MSRDDLPPTPMGPLPDRDDDPIVAALRQALEAEADAVRPSGDGLRRIREAIEDQRGAGGRRWWPALAAVAGVVAIGLAVGTATLPGLLDPDRGRPPAGASPSPAPSGGASSAASPDASPTDPSATPVYWVHPTRTRFWLFREWDHVGTPSAQAAVDRMLAGGPADPDFTSIWRPATATVEVGPDAITVNLGAEAFADAAVGSAAAQAAVQQLVYTVTAAASMTAPTGAATPPVRILVDGRAGYNAWGAVRLGVPMTRDTALAAPVWLETPSQGAQVAGRVNITGYGSAFEGNLLWEVTRGSGTVVKSGQVQVSGDATPKAFAVTVDLPPGTYTVSVWGNDPSGGANPDGPRLNLDTKDFTVR